MVSAAALAAVVALAVVSPALAQRPAAAFTWDVPERIQGDDAGNLRTPGVMNWLGDGSDYTLDGPVPKSFPVRFNACESRGGAGAIESFDWTVDGEPIRAPEGCGPFVHRFEDEGVYEVTLTVTTGNEESAVTQAVRVEDWLIVSLGDSVASGEGNPDIFKAPGTPEPVWRDRRCHRSGRAGPARAALIVERADPKTSVTFVHLACSGATITSGLLGDFKGKRPQADVFRELARAREVDAVMLSVGANDIHFSDVVKVCLVDPKCDERSFLLRKVAPALDYLPTGYRTLADHLHGPTGVPPDRVLMTDYFNPARDGEEYCERAGELPDNLITPDEWRFAETVVLARLNAAVRRAAGRHGWTPVTGFDGLTDRAGFFNHGFCRLDRWVLRIGDSRARQGDVQGGVHPNGFGHRFYGRVLGGELIRTLYRKGDLSRPRHPTEPPGPGAGGELPDETLARMFRPRLLFSEREHWRPLEIDAFLEEGQHWLCQRLPANAVNELPGVGSDVGPGCRRLRDVADLLLVPPDRADRLVVNGIHSSSVDAYRARSLDCNAGVQDGAFRARLFDCDSGDGSAIYWHVARPKGSTMAYIDYWWFLRYNDTDLPMFFAHQADWEGMVVAVDLRSRPRTFAWASYSAHKGAPWRYPRELMRCDGVTRGSCGTEVDPRGRRPAVYIADGSHAAYALPCERNGIKDCGQNETPFYSVERDFAGARQWGRNDDRHALLPFPEASWAEWPGAWNGAGGAVRTPALQPRWKQPWRHRSTGCKRVWCAAPLQIARLHDKHCGGQPGGTPAVLVCAPGGAVLIERFSAGRITPRQRERGEGVVELRGAALDEGRVEVSGALPAGTAVFVRGVGERLEEHEAAFLLDEAADGSALLRITVTARGNPALVVVRGKSEQNVRPEIDARVS